GADRCALSRGTRSRAAARAAAGQHHLGRANAERVLQRLVVVAAGAGAGHGAYPRFARARHHGARRVRQPARAQVGVSMSAILEVSNLQVSYYTELGRAKALDGVSYTLKAGEKMGRVG